MKKLIIIANPLAGDGRRAALLNQASLIDARFELVLFEVRSDEDVQRAFAATRGEDVAALVIFGGDGTVNRCLPLLADLHVPVAVFPVGTVNDLALMLGMRPDWLRLGDLIEQNSTDRLRLLEVNGQPFAVYGTLGLGAEASRRLQAARARMAVFRQAFPRLQTPLFTAWTALFTRGYARRLRFTMDDDVHEFHSAGVYVTNQTKVNRKIDLEWDPSIDPTLFRVVAFKSMPKGQLLRTVFRLASSGRLSAIRDAVEVFDVAHAEITAIDGTPLAFRADGEPLLESSVLRIGVAKASVLVYRDRDTAT